MCQLPFQWNKSNIINNCKILYEFVIKEMKLNYCHRHIHILRMHTCMPSSRVLYIYNLMLLLYLLLLQCIHVYVDKWLVSNSWSRFQHFFSRSESLATKVHLGLTTFSPIHFSPTLPGIHLNPHDNHFWSSSDGTMTWAHEKKNVYPGPRGAENIP